MNSPYSVLFIVYTSLFLYILYGLSSLERSWRFSRLFGSNYFNKHSKVLFNVAFQLIVPIMLKTKDRDFNLTERNKNPLTLKRRPSTKPRYSRHRLSFSPSLYKTQHNTRARRQAGRQTSSVRPCAHSSSFAVHPVSVQSLQLSFNASCTEENQKQQSSRKSRTAAMAAETTTRMLYNRPGPLQIFTRPK